MKIRSGIATLLLTTAVIFLASCTRSNHAEDLKKVDSLNMVLDETALTFEEIQIDTLSYLFGIFQTNAEEIKANYTKEDDEGWKIVCRYTDLKKPFRNTVEYYKNIQQELIFTQQQLDSLRHDVQNDILTEKLIKEYLEDEKQAIVDLKDMISKNLATSQIIINDFDSLNTLIEKILKNQN